MNANIKIDPTPALPESEGDLNPEFITKKKSGQYPVDFCYPPGILSICPVVFKPYNNRIKYIFLCKNRDFVFCNLNINVLSEKVV